MKIKCQKWHLKIATACSVGRIWYSNTLSCHIHASLPSNLKTPLQFLQLFLMISFRLPLYQPLFNMEQKAQRPRLYVVLLQQTVYHWAISIQRLGQCYLKPLFAAAAVH